MLVIGPMALILFIGTEWKLAKLPMMPLHIFSSASTAIIFTQNLLFGFVWQADLYFLPIYFQEVRGYSPIRSALLILPLLLLQSVAGVLSGQIMRKISGFRPVLYMVFVLWTTGAGLKVLFSRSSPVSIYVISLMIEGAGMGFIFQPGTSVQMFKGFKANTNTALVALQALSKPEDRAVVTSTRNMLRALGSAIGVAASTAIQYAVMKADLPAELPSDLRSQVLDGSWHIGSSDSGEWTDGILDAKMKGTHIVFITFVPLVGLCLLGCLWIKDRVLKSDAKPLNKTELTK
jgi:hypothetical protein